MSRDPIRLAAKLLFSLVIISTLLAVPTRSHGQTPPDVTPDVTPGGAAVLADLRGRDLARADLAGVDLALANLTDADLTQADLTGARLEATTLTGADLSGAMLGTVGRTSTPSSPIRLSIRCWIETRVLRLAL